MNNSITAHEEKLAILGGIPAFNKPIPVGQLYFPNWNDYENSFRKLFRRKYYTNHGPLTEIFEANLAEYLKVRNVVCVTNATIGLSIVAEAMQLKGKVITPAFTFIATTQSLIWSDLIPVFCDVDIKTHHLDYDCVNELLNTQEDIGAILAVNLWGDSCDTLQLQALAEKHGVALYFDSAQAFGCQFNNQPIGRFGRAEVFSFHATKVLSTTEGGCIATNDDELAERIRNVRSSYGTRKNIDVNRTANGRFSEAQAAIGILSLESLDKNINNNVMIYQAYKERLHHVPGIKLNQPSVVSVSNYQYIVCEIDEELFGLSRDQLHTVLHAENIIVRRYFSPGAHKTLPFEKLHNYEYELPSTDYLCKNLIQLPIGARTSIEIVEKICTKIKLINRYAKKIHSKLMEQ